ncbi:PREDICTED: insulin-like growth factor 2 mRNA-binding protein 1 [Sturnus vulgaris]|uniref:insulin-like growth factor 2 mRNA-binding protein 1 n=1 Tax=Sturnus vulgaris TaxID=9172 RepID=UPI00071A3737|nr:PREDICTED: insulin-like growth factor 2 mRNA-binding protein 1 [Sturnus vulgaris]
MNKLYIGNLPEGVTAAELEKVFAEHRISFSGHFLVKSGYAFVDCPDEHWAMKAIETFSGKVELHGKQLEIEHSVPKKQRSRKIQIRNIPPQLRWEPFSRIPVPFFGNPDLFLEFPAPFLEFLSPFLQSPAPFPEFPAPFPESPAVNTDSETAVVNVTYANREQTRHTITVRGCPESCCRAEQEIMRRVREAYENDVAAMSLQSHLIPGLNLAAVGLFPASSTALPPPPGGSGAAPYSSFLEEVKLETHIRVPASAAGRVIGKGGKTVNELQNLTAAEVVVPREQTPDENEQVIVKIIGHFYASQVF